MSEQIVYRPAPPATWRGQALATARLAGPVIVARAGMLVLAAVDTIMTGRAGPAELASFGIGMAPQVSLMLIGIGCLLGTGILVAQAYGAGEHARCGAIWRVAVWHAGALGILMSGVCLLGEPFLSAIGQDPELARGGGEVLAMFSWSMPAIMIYVATSSFLEAIGKPRPGMIAMLFANIANVALNWIFIYGNMGAEPMGANGAAFATSIVRWCMAIGLVAYCLLWLPGRRGFGLFERTAEWRTIGAKLRRLGLPLGVAQGLETTAFMAVAMFAGYLGQAAMAGYQVAINLVSMIFMGAIGLATATAVQVGQAVGRGDQLGLRLAGWIGFILVALVMGLLGLLVGLYPGALAGVYTSDQLVLRLAVEALAVGALFLVFDGAQAVLMGATRGAGDVVVPLFLQGAAFWLLAVPAAWLCGLKLELGPAGLMLGLFLGVIASSSTLAWRFWVVSRRVVRRI